MVGLCGPRGGGGISVQKRLKVVNATFFFLKLESCEPGPLFKLYKTSHLALFEKLYETSYIELLYLMMMSTLH